MPPPDLMLGAPSPFSAVPLPGSPWRATLPAFGRALSDTTHDAVTERFLAEGADTLNDREMLDLLMRDIVAEDDRNRIVAALIDRFGDYCGVLRADTRALCAVDGMSLSAAVMLKAVGDAAVRLARTEIINRPILASSRELLAYLRAEMARHPTERLRGLFLDIKNRLVTDEVLQVGTVNSVPVDSRAVIKRALELEASGIILVHNHPSGDPCPSRVDIEFTQKVRDAGDLFDIALHDHIVIARQGHSSFRDMGLL
jgi:DNA repair protein RadC